MIKIDTLELPLILTGKKAPRHDPRTLKMAKYFDRATFANPPPAWKWSPKVGSWPMFGNDVAGNCTYAAGGHMIECWSANGQGSELVITDTDVIGGYSRLTGYDPNDPSTDNGAIELDVLRDWQKNGIGGHVIGAFGAIAPKDMKTVVNSIYTFGGIYTGFALPKSAQQQVAGGLLYLPVGGAVNDGAPGSWGGHAVPIIDYDAQGVTCVTWARLVKMTWKFFFTYCDEAYAIVSKDFLSAKTGTTPTGFNLSVLNQDLEIAQSLPAAA